MYATLLAMSQDATSMLGTAISVLRAAQLTFCTMEPATLNAMLPNATLMKETSSNQQRSFSIGYFHYSRGVPLCVIVDSREV
mmetsp:Transcript_5774/g.10308  ORF Transcript_5774/g.10308 Transcript_5774/m.10308 type:complete len:82 (+) Transcript_5774:570-815(+)